MEKLYENVKKSIVVIDMPYKSYINKVMAFKNARKLINFTKANVLKLEVQKKTIPIIKYLLKKIKCYCSYWCYSTKFH